MKFHDKLRWDGFELDNSYCACVLNELSVLFVMSVCPLLKHMFFMLFVESSTDNEFCYLTKVMLMTLKNVIRDDIHML